MAKQAKTYVSKEINLDLANLENPFKRADIEFDGIDHSGPSYEGRVFVNNKNANQSTPKTYDNGYVGSFYMFAHSGCYGDPGHCEIGTGRRPYDYRPSHPLTPAYKRVIATEKLRELAKTTDKFIVTVVPIVASGISATKDLDLRNVVKLESVSI